MCVSIDRSRGQGNVAETHVRDDYLLSLEEVEDASTFREKLAAASALHELELAHPELTAKLIAESDQEPNPPVIHSPEEHRGCIRGLLGDSHLNHTLGISMGRDQMTRRDSSSNWQTGEIAWRRQTLNI